ncbi:hypothetical protein [Alicycliphilus denitrificans]|uniref:hypothetical protein n=1 Tax=Alicycliphilus denitrificans TaxID=179636 RepID=UPI0001DA022E|nr:hypothetical protein [Alicycliphilus denitrificans]ADU98995.1 hypothetical protein Alide_1234 [Alicycliphilus denitrificans BC]
MKKHPTRHKPDPLCTPVGRALALQALRRDMLDIGLACLAVEHGSEQRALLARLAFMIGIGAELAAALPVPGDNRAGMHQALAEVVRMACDGCAWDAAWAAQLQLALEISGELMLEHSSHAMRVLPGARALADDIAKGNIRPDAVAPLEWLEQ